MSTKLKRLMILAVSLLIALGVLNFPEKKKNSKKSSCKNKADNGKKANEEPEKAQKTDENRPPCLSPKYFGQSLIWDCPLNAVAGKNRLLKECS